MSYYLSYLMGAERIEDKELEDLSVKIKNKDSDGDRSIKIPEDRLSQYIELIKNKLTNGFWNEIIGAKEIIFIFKFKDGSIKEFKLSPTQSLLYHFSSNSTTGSCQFPQSLQSW